MSDLATSVAFYALAGFEVAYERPAEGFAFLALPQAQLMLQVAAGPGRRFRTAPLERPYGRGVNLQLEVRDVDGLYRRFVDAGHHVVVPVEERWYRAGDTEVGHRQFVVADPDGYLLRPYMPLALRSI